MSTVESLPEGCTILERTLPDGRVLTFEQFPAGTPTKAGTPRLSEWRAYKLDGRRLPSVTTLISACIPKDALMKWHEDRGAEGALRAARMGELDGVPPEEAGDRVRLLKLGADSARDRAAVRGLNVHDILEEWGRSQAVPSLADHPPEHAGHIQGLAKFLLKYQPEPICVEKIVCNPELGYAGRIDMRAVIGDRDVIVDLKSSSKARIYPEAHLQTGLYSMCEEPCGDTEPDGAIIVAIGEDGSYEVQECLATPAFCEVMLRWQDALKTLRTGVDRQARAVAKGAA